MAAPPNNVVYVRADGTPCDRFGNPLSTAKTQRQLQMVNVSAADIARATSSPSVTARPGAASNAAAKPPAVAATPAVAAAAAAPVGSAANPLAPAAAVAAPAASAPPYHSVVPNANPPMSQQREGVPDTPPPAQATTTAVPNAANIPPKPAGSSGGGVVAAGSGGSSVGGGSALSVAEQDRFSVQRLDALRSEYTAQVSTAVLALPPELEDNPAALGNGDKKFGYEVLAQMRAFVNEENKRRREYTPAQRHAQERWADLRRPAYYEHCECCSGHCDCTLMCAAPFLKRNDTPCNAVCCQCCLTEWCENRDRYCCWRTTVVTAAWIVCCPLHCLGTCVYACQRTLCCMSHDDSIAGRPDMQALECIRDADALKSRRDQVAALEAVCAATYRDQAMAQIDQRQAAAELAAVQQKKLVAAMQMQRQTDR